MVFWFWMVLLSWKLKKMKRPKSMLNPYVNCEVSFPEPWVAIRQPGVRVALGDPCEVITAVSRYCVPIFTLFNDPITSKIKSYAHYFHEIKGVNQPNIVVSYLSIPRLVLAMRTDAALRAIVLAAPISISEG
ncbi:hypothetical protein [Microvirus mar46]|uniref:Uncharacterized protein n=1 Tax=Microvirus mar46 TaxID=2851181 RepID=A0A8F5MJB2_9VIRU|nr:hypothetical protein [Microvirus mar46]